MKFSWLHNIWKVPLCGLLFFLGFIPGGMLAGLLGLTIPDLPAGTDQQTIAQYTLLASLIMAGILAPLARGLSVNFFSRWMILFGLIWVAYGVNTYLEASIFSTMGEISLYTVVLYFPASLLCSAAIAWLFPPSPPVNGFMTQARTFFAQHTARDWTWRFSVAFLAFPITYYIFGILISPIVLPYYQQGTNQLALPGWEVLLPVLASRSLLFLLVCLPVLIAWKGSNLRLFFALGLALFVLVGGIGMLEAYWLPPVLRVTHSIEIFADEMIYTAALILLLGKVNTQSEVERQLVPAS
jgi:hypothetical protein